MVNGVSFCSKYGIKYLIFIVHVGCIRAFTSKSGSQEVIFIVHVGCIRAFTSKSGSQGGDNYAQARGECINTLDSARK